MDLSPQERQALERFRAMSDTQQKSLVSFFGELLAGLKSEWESRPENQGRTVTYTELWQDYTAGAGMCDAIRPVDAQTDQPEGA